MSGPYRILMEKTKAAFIFSVGFRSQGKLSQWVLSSEGRGYKGDTPVHRWVDFCLAFGASPDVKLAVAMVTGWHVEELPDANGGTDSPV